MNGDVSNKDQFLPPGYGSDQAWLERFRVDSTHSTSDTQVSQQIEKKDHYPFLSYDRMVSAKDEKGFSRVDQRDVLEEQPAVPQLMASGGVAVFAGLDANKQPVYAIQEPSAMQPWLVGNPKVDSVEVKQTEEEKLAGGGAAIKPETSSGLLAVLGRLAATPLARIDKFFRKWAGQVANTMIAVGNRIIPPVWKPIERAISRAVSWTNHQIDAARPYVSKAIGWAGRTGKKVLDTLIIDAPKAAVTAFRGWLARFNRWLSS